MTKDPNASGRTTFNIRHRNGFAGLLLAGLLGLGLGTVRGQDAGQIPPPSPPPPPPALLVFIEAAGLDSLALVKDLGFARPVPGPADAQVLVRIASRPVEAGTEYLLSFVGQHDFLGVNDELRTSVEPGAGPEDSLKAAAQTLKLGLVRYVARTPMSADLRIALLDKVSPTAVSDPWNFWVFSLSAYGMLSGVKTYNSQMYFGSLTAQRVTESLKFKLSAGFTIQKDKYDLPDYQYSSSLDSRYLQGMIAKSLNDHWSIGGGIEFSTSLFSNVRQGLELMPGIEYNVFPYSQSTKRQLRLLYRVGFRSFNYFEETIYDKTKEWLWGQSLTATLELVQPWGTISTSLEGFHYFHDPSKYRLELNSEISLRIVQGLDFNLYGGGSWIHNQLSLPKAGSTFEDVILQRKEQATTYNYFFMIGLSFSFGSVRSNVVNPRFSSGGSSISISL